jgi:hypothetical protein
MLQTAIGHLIKVDLTPASGYRVLYGAFFREQTMEVSFETLMLPKERIVSDVFKTVAYLSRTRGPWTETPHHPNNCQDFVFRFLSYFGVTNSQLFPYELRRAVNRWNPPRITEYEDDENDELLRAQPLVFIHSR